MDENKYLIKSKCTDCGQTNYSVTHIHKCPFCHSLNIVNTFEETSNIPSEIEDKRLTLERLFREN